MNVHVGWALLLLMGCSSAPLECDRLQVRSDKLAPSAGPPPYYGYSLFGSVSLKRLPEGIVVGPNSQLKRMVGAEGTADFVPKYSRVRIADGVLYFKGVIDEKDFFKVTGLLPHSPAVRIEFEASNGHAWSAKGTMETLMPEHPPHADLQRGLQD